MLFRKYHIVIFKDGEAPFRSMNVRGGLLVFFFLLLIALGAATVYLWDFYARSITLESQLREAQISAQAQNAQVVSLAATLQDLQSDLHRVQQFDAKLRVMMNVDREGADMSATQDDAQEDEEYARSGTPYLPLHRQELLARRMHSLADQIGEDLVLEEVSQQDLLLLLRDNRELLATTPSIWPSEGYLSSRFGSRTSPITGVVTRHQGLDIANRIGTPIIAPAKGVVTFAGWDGAYGNAVVIDHGNNLSTRYAHMNKFVVEEGQTVMRGDLIGHVGNTGRSTGPHLHYEVRVGGVPVDPMRYILN